MMACENGGAYAYIPALGAVRVTTQQYLQNLSEPVKADDPMGARWSTAYADAITGKSVISAALPAFRMIPDTGEAQFEGG